MGDKETALENLRKAQGKQTGPVTPEGMDKVSRNAIKHGGYSEKKIVGNCKGEDCWLHKSGRCSFLVNGDVKKGDICKQRFEDVLTMSRNLREQPAETAKEMTTLNVSMQEDTIQAAYAYISEEGIMVDRVIGMSKDGDPIISRLPHGALDYFRRATKDLNQILKDLTGFNVDQEKGPGYLMEDVLKALAREEPAA